MCPSEGGAGITHTVSVCAESLYEAGAFALAEFKGPGFAFGGVGPGAKLNVAAQATGWNQSCNTTFNSEL